MRILSTSLVVLLSGCIGTCEPTPPPPAPVASSSAVASARPIDASKPDAAPAPVDAAALADRGKTLYGRYCDFCHGKDGHGYAADEAPALANDDLLTIATDEYLRDAILKGRPGTTMSAWGLARGGPIGADDATALVSFLRSWQKRPASKLEERKSEGDVAHGATLYANHCVKCHGPKGSGGKYNALSNHELLAEASDAFLATTIEHGRSGTPMPAFGEKLSKKDVDDLVVAIRSWQKTPDTEIELPPKPGALKNVVINPRGKQPDFPENVDFIKVDVVKAELDKGASMIVVDARAPGDYALMHVAGAISVPFYLVNDYAKEIPKDRYILTYCACPHAASVKARDALRALGYKRVAVLDEGVNVWRDRGYPVRGGGTKP